MPDATPKPTLYLNIGQSSYLPWDAPGRIEAAGWSAIIDPDTEGLANHEAAELIDRNLATSVAMLFCWCDPTPVSLLRLGQAIEAKIPVIALGSSGLHPREFRRTRMRMVYNLDEVIVVLKNWSLRLRPIAERSPAHLLQAIQVMVQNDERVGGALGWWR